MSEQVPITTVIPTYQRAELITRCLSSVLEQSRPPAQVVVVDDGSTDDTLAVLRGFGDRVEVVSQPNQGASAARNHGVAEARHDWIAFCDSDDLWERDHLERLWGAVDATGGEAALYFDDTAIAASDGGGTFFDVAGLRVDDHRVAEPPVEWIHGRLQPMLLQSSLVRRAVYEDLGGLWTELGTRHDTHLFYRIGFAHPMCAVAGTGVHLCDDAGDAARLTGHSGQSSRTFWAESLLMHQDLADRAPDGASRRALRRHVSGDRVRLAGHAARAGERSAAVSQLAKATSVSPATVATLAARGLRRRLLGARGDVARIPR